MSDADSNQKKSDPDGELVERARGGDYEAFERLVERYERPIYTMALRMLQNEQDAQEAVQETFLSVVEHLGKFKGSSTFFTWLVRIATNHALKALRRRKGSRAVEMDAADDDERLPRPGFIADWREDPAQIAQRREVKQVLADALGELDEKYRLVFILRDVEGLSTEEAAEALEISTANAKVRLMRARLMLREKLTRIFGDETRQVRAHENDEHV